MISIVVFAMPSHFPGKVRLCRNCKRHIQDGERTFNVVAQTTELPALIAAGKGPHLCQKCAKEMCAKLAAAIESPQTLRIEKIAG